MAISSHACFSSNAGRKKHACFSNNLSCGASASTLAAAAWCPLAPSSAPSHSPRCPSEQCQTRPWQNIIPIQSCNLPSKKQLAKHFNFCSWVSAGSVSLSWSMMENNCLAFSSSSLLRAPNRLYGWQGKPAVYNITWQKGSEHTP